MDISLGFEIGNPKAFIPWGINEEELQEILGDNLYYVTRGYYTISCHSLGGMKHNLGFHYEPRKNGVLKELEFFRSSYKDQEASYIDFQNHFEAAFGPPTTSQEGGEGFPTHEWKLKRLTIRHSVFDRFGPEEHMRIRHKSPKKSISLYRKKHNSK